MENYSLLMGAAAVMKMAGDGSGVDGEAFRGTSPVRQGAGTETHVPDLGFMAAAWKVSRTVASSERDEPDSYRYSPSLDGELPSSWSSSGDEDGGEMAAVSMEKLRGHFPVRPGTETPVPQILLRDGGGSEGFAYRGFFRGARRRGFI
ncbi:hypothetical protein QYE76_051367 [Lolium multiflorum]|uniref:Uncharacterized protein n=1 Tax=Lolium multiflorum TaxID=4521 RepID=A0AAD8SRR3_LOLMU|nr:hypothetical protein QYE76_051367 [Lolium multiflorum]